jgi:hypothetical protein
MFLKDDSCCLGQEMCSGSVAPGNIFVATVCVCIHRFLCVTTVGIPESVASNGRVGGE